MPGEDEIDPCGAVPMNAKAADLGQEFARRPILRQSNGSPGTGRIISGEDTGCPGQVPSRGEQQRYRPRQHPAGPVGREIDVSQSADGKIPPATAWEPFLEGMIDPPSPAWRVENQDLCPLQPFRPRPVFPIAVAGIEPASMRDQQAHFRAAGKPPRLITRACRIGYLEIVRAARLHESGDRRKAECQYHENAPARVAQ